MAKRPLRRKICGWCDQSLERAAKGHCGRIWSTWPDGSPMPDCWWVAAIRDHGPEGALKLSGGSLPHPTGSGRPR